jgi:flavin reductase (DIM6/NTAB) family NADH-FMN oxidoreductase RutF
MQQEVVVPDATSPNDPMAEARRFRNACGRFATGVTVVTAVTQTGTRGMTANAFMSVSLEPKLVAVSLASTARMHAILGQETSRFAISILSNGQAAIADRFAGRHGGRWGPSWKRVSNDFEVIGGCLAWFACELSQRVVAGDHTLVIGHVLQFDEMETGEPLVFYSGRYHRQLQASVDVEYEWFY